MSALASLVVPSWLLKLALYSLHTVDTVDGVSSVRSHVYSVGPQRCAPSQPNVVFDMPSGGLRAPMLLVLSPRPCLSTASLPYSSPSALPCSSACRPRQCGQDESDANRTLTVSLIQVREAICS